MCMSCNLLADSYLGKFLIISGKTIAGFFDPQSNSEIDTYY